MVIMIGSEHLSNEQLGLGRIDCNDAEKAMLAALSAAYIGKLAAELEVPSSSFGQHGPFFPARATYAQLRPQRPVHSGIPGQSIISPDQNITPGI